MIRTSREIPYFGLWRDAAVFRELAHPRYLTTARYEPVTFRKFGSGHIDLLFEFAEQSCIVGGVRLDPNNLVVRERSPLIWPVALAQIIDETQLRAIEAAIIPWLRSLARGRVMASESIRRFALSERFDRARASGLVGAALLESTMPRMAPFIYARRFARGARVRLACADAALGAAVLGDIAAGIDQTEPGGADEAFARSWYGVVSPAAARGKADVVITAEHGVFAADVVVETIVSADSSAAITAVPTPVPYDVIFSFDAADAPGLAPFGVLAHDAPLRDCDPVPSVRSAGTSTGVIALAVSPEALGIHGDDIDEVKTLGRLLANEGLRVHLVSQTTDPGLAQAQLIHIFGDATEAHTLAFAEFARERGIDYVLDLVPEPIDPSSDLEMTLYTMFLASFDDYDKERYLAAFELSKLDTPETPMATAEPTPEEFARRAERFSELARGATAILTVAQDVDRRRAALPPEVANRVRARGTFLESEPPAGPIGHIVPRAPFALIHAPIAKRSASLFPAFAAELRGIPIVIAGAVYDVDYLHVLRAIAPNAIVLADAAAGVISALYRQAAIFIDAAPRPRSVNGLLRGIACGALPVLIRESPLARVMGDVVPTFSLRSLGECGQAMADAMTLADGEGRIETLRAQVAQARDQQSSLATVLEVYSRLAAPV
jgi:hypothetical protein